MAKLRARRLGGLTRIVTLCPAATCTVVPPWPVKPDVAVAVVTWTVAAARSAEMTS